MSGGFNKVVGLKKHEEDIPAKALCYVSNTMSCMHKAFASQGKDEKHAS